MGPPPCVMMRLVRRPVVLIARCQSDRHRVSPLCAPRFEMSKTGGDLLLCCYALKQKRSNFEPPFARPLRTFLCVPRGRWGVVAYLHFQQLGGGSDRGGACVPSREVWAPGDSHKAMCAKYSIAHAFFTSIGRVEIQYSQDFELLIDLNTCARRGARNPSKAPTRPPFEPLACPLDDFFKGVRRRAEVAGGWTIRGWQGVDRSVGHKTVLIRAPRASGGGWAGSRRQWN